MTLHGAGHFLQEDAGETLLRLPLFAGLTEDDQARVVEGVLALAGQRPVILDIKR